MKKQFTNLPLLSIIVPVYNVEKYISRCINSILQQDYTNFEIIAINDGSTDRSGKILEEISKLDRRIIFFNVANGGVSKARNIGLSKASGEYVAFVDADDLVKSDIYSRMIYEAISKKCDIVQCNYEELYENGEIRKMIGIDEEMYVNNNDIIISCMERKISANVFTKIYKKDVIKDILFDENISYAEDLKFVVECCGRASKISTLNFYGYQYFIRMSSADHSQINENFLSILTVSDFFLKKYKYNNDVYPFIEKNDILQTKYLIDRISSQLNNDMRKFLPILRKRILAEKREIKKNIFRNNDMVKIFLITYIPYAYYFSYYLYNKYIKKYFK